LTPLSAKLFAHPMYHETNAFWELKLEETPEEMLTYARDRAVQYIQEASELYVNLDHHNPAYDTLGDFLTTARAELKAGDAEAEEQDSIGGLARLVRFYTRAQVRARQVINALVPPATRPEDLS
jgi:hypothetical protein